MMVEWGTLEADLLYQKIKFGKPELDGNSFFGSSSAKDFIEKMLVKDPNSRITIGDSLLHPFITRKVEDTVDQKLKVSYLIAEMSPLNCILGQAPIAFLKTEIISQTCEQVILTNLAEKGR